MTFLFAIGILVTTPAVYVLLRFTLPTVWAPLIAGVVTLGYLYIVLTAFAMLTVL